MQRFVIIWSYLVGGLNLLTLALRIFITYWTRRHLTPKIDTMNPMIESMMLTITVIDWFTPYSLVYCYYNISIKKNNEEHSRSFDMSPLMGRRRDSLGTEALRMILGGQKKVKNNNADVTN